MFLHRQEFRRLFQRSAKEENEGNDEAADEERNSPLGEFDPPRNAIVSPVTASFSANPMVAATKIATCWLADWNEV